MIGKVDIDYSSLLQQEYGEKINELIDAANEYEEDREEIKAWIAIVSDLRSRVPVVESRVAILEEHAHPTAKTPDDPYTEQRKWVGKLCRFWDDDYKTTKHIGILTRIDETAIVKYKADNLLWYCACEPVKPDDDIIYKGE